MQPDYQAIRNRTLDKLKMSKGSTGGMVIDAFIKELRQQTAGASVQPDYEAIRNRTLDKLKMSKGSTAGRVIDAFIEELKHGF